MINVSKGLKKDARRYADKVLDMNKRFRREIREIQNPTIEKEEKDSSGTESNLNPYRNHFPEIPAIESNFGVFLWEPTGIM